MAERTGSVSAGMIDVVDFPAGRTFIDMPPQLTGAAGSQVIYGPAVIWRDFPAKGLKIIRAMHSKDIADSCHSWFMRLSTTGMAVDLVFSLKWA
jgi:hypothetical protein